MAIGDVIADTESVSTGAYMTIQPNAGAEWVIHNLYWGSSTAIEISRYSTSAESVFAQDTTYGALLNVFMHINNTDYLRIKNASTVAAVVCGYDGIVTKST